MSCTRSSHWCCTQSWRRAGAPPLVVISLLSLLPLTPTMSDNKEQEFKIQPHPAKSNFPGSDAEATPGAFLAPPALSSALAVDAVPRRAALACALSAARPMTSADSCPPRRPRLGSQPRPPARQPARRPRRQPSRHGRQARGAQVARRAQEPPGAAQRQLGRRAVAPWLVDGGQRRRAVRRRTSSFLSVVPLPPSPLPRVPVARPRP